MKYLSRTIFGGGDIQIFIPWKSKLAKIQLSLYIPWSSKIHLRFEDSHWIYRGWKIYGFPCGKKGPGHMFWPCVTPSEPLGPKGSNVSISKPKSHLACPWPRLSSCGGVDRRWCLLMTPFFVGFSKSTRIPCKSWEPPATKKICKQGLCCRGANLEGLL